jgi:hypothetical protein
MSAMGISRDISFPTHTVVELTLGLITMIAPAALGASDIGIVVSVLFGATMMGLAMSGIGVLERREDRPAMPVELHQVMDQAVGTGLIVGAGLLGLAGDPITATILVAVAVADLGLELSTRYRTAS